jgi:PASTA domain
MGIKRVYRRGFGDKNPITPESRLVCFASSSARKLFQLRVYRFGPAWRAGCGHNRARVFFLRTLSLLLADLRHVSLVIVTTKIVSFAGEGRMSSFDVEALVRAVLVGIGCGCLTGMIGYFVTRSDWPRRVPVLIMGGCGVGLLAGVAMYYALPRRSTIPALANLSQTEAEDLLMKHKLIPSARPQYAQGVPAGRVIPQSQSPGPGLLVANESVVTFGVSQQSMAEQSPSRSLSPAGESDLQLFEPKDRGMLKCSKGVGGITRCSVSGITGDMSGVRLLLWLQPVAPRVKRLVGIFNGRQRTGSNA